MKMIQIEGINWNIKNLAGTSPLSTALTLTSFKTDCIQELLKIQDLNLEVDNPWTNDILVHECKQFLRERVMKEDSRTINVLNSPTVYAIKFNHRFAKVLKTAHDAADDCRAYVASVMANDETLTQGENISELVYALRKNMDNFATVLASDPKEWDIQCLVLHILEIK